MRTRTRGRWPLALTAVLLLLAGCGKSSKSPSATTASTPPATTASTPSATTSTAATPQPPASSAPAGAHTVSASSLGVTATLHAGTHTPRVGHKWPIRFTVRRGRRPVKAGVSYQYLFGGQVVARRSHYTFTGSFSDTFIWPSSAVGFPLTFRAVITAAGATINLDYPVRVAR